MVKYFALSLGLYDPIGQHWLSLRNFVITWHSLPGLKSLQRLENIVQVHFC